MKDHHNQEISERIRALVLSQNEVYSCRTSLDMVKEVKTKLYGAYYCESFTQDIKTALDSANSALDKAIALIEHTLIGLDDEFGERFMSLMEEFRDDSGN